MKKLAYVLVLITLQWGCGNGGKTPADTATSGTVWIAVDESLRPVVEAEAQVFEAIYPNAHLNLIFTSEANAFRLLQTDSLKLVIATRHLTDAEKTHFDDVKIVPRYSPFATDAIAIILNREVKDSVFTPEQLRNVLNGTYTGWKQINPGGADKPVQVVFDNAGSGAVRYLTDSLLAGAALAKHCYAVEDNQKVIEHVEKHPGSIGIIGMSWISDIDDTLSHGFLNRIRVANLVPRDPATAEAPSMKPYQAYVALKQYPLWRTIEMINCTGRTGLGTGFASFIASDRGQRIVLKAGMVPATAPVRIIKTK